MIQFVMSQSSAGFSWLSPHYPDLDLAKTILVRWGDFVPWSWSICDDEHITGLECVTYLVSATVLISTSLIIREPDSYVALSCTPTFLLNGYMPSFCNSSGISGCKQRSITMHSHSSNYRGTRPHTSIKHYFVFQQVLHQTSTQLREAYDSQLFETLPPPLTLVLCKSCGMTIQLLRLDIDKVRSRVADFGRCLLSLFCILREEEGEVKRMLGGITIPIYFNTHFFRSKDPYSRSTNLNSSSNVGYVHSAGPTRR